MTEENKDKWPEELEHLWHPEKQLQTTICYLTIPKVMAHNATYPLGMIEEEVSVIDIQGSESWLVELSTLQDKKARAKRFNDALRALRLKPYVHPSQLNEKVSATSSSHDAMQVKSEKVDEEQDKSKAKGELIHHHTPV